MTSSRRHLLLATVFVLALAPVAMSRAEESATVPTNPAFNPATGQINPGRTEQAPAASQPGRAIPTPEESRAALLEPVSTQPSLGAANAGATSGSGRADQGASGNTANGNSANAANGEPPPSGPIGSVGQTLPAKFSKRNDILDRTPIMAFPLRLSDEDRQKIYTAVMADKSAPVAGAEKLLPASQLSTEQALDGMHPLPESLRGIAQVQRFKYVKAKDKVLLVEPSTRVVVDQIKS